jgi:hypothetical protein
MINTNAPCTRLSDLAYDWAVVARQRVQGGSRGLLHWEYLVPIQELRDALTRGHLSTVQRRDPDAVVLLARRPR